MSAQEIAVGVTLAAGGLAGLVYIAKWVRTIVHTVDQLLKLMQPTHDVAVYELTNNGGGSLKDKVEAALLTAQAARDSAAATRGLVQVVANEMTAHGHQSRAAMAIYRAALADQGIHLPVAPGEHGELEEHE